MWPSIRKCQGLINNDTLESCFWSNNVKDSYNVLALKVFNSDNIYTFSFRIKLNVYFVKKLQLKISVYEIINIDI